MAVCVHLTECVNQSVFVCAGLFICMCLCVTLNRNHFCAQLQCSAPSGHMFTRMCVCLLLCVHWESVCLRVYVMIKLLTFGNALSDTDSI